MGLDEGWDALYSEKEDGEATELESPQRYLWPASMVISLYQCPGHLYTDWQRSGGKQGAQSA